MVYIPYTAMIVKHNHDVFRDQLPSAWTTMIVVRVCFFLISSPTKQGSCDVIKAQAILVCDVKRSE